MLAEKQILPLGVQEIPAFQAAIDLSQACNQNGKQIWHIVHGSVAKYAAAIVEDKLEGTEQPHDVDALVDYEHKDELDDVLIGEFGYTKTRKIQVPGTIRMSPHHRYIYIKKLEPTRQEKPQERILDISFGHFNDKQITFEEPMSLSSSKSRSPILVYYTFSKTMLEGIAYTVGEDTINAFHPEVLLYRNNYILKVLEATRRKNDPKIAKLRRGLQFLQTIESDRDVYEEIHHDQPPAGVYIRTGFRWPLVTTKQTDALTSLLRTIAKVKSFVS